MRRYRKFFTSIILVSSLILCACGGEPQAQNGEGGGYRSEFTTEELESGHASFQMEEKLIVDAQVTPKTSYEDGLSSYYTEIITEPNSEDSDSFVKNATFSSLSHDEWEKLLNKLQKGKLEKKKFEVSSIEEIEQEKFVGENGRTYIIWAGWSGKSKKYGLTSKYNTAGSTIFPSNNEENFENNSIPAKIKENFSDYGEYNDLDFLQNPDETAANIREFLEKFSGRKICEKYDFIPAGQKNLERLYELAKEKEPTFVEMIEPELKKRIGEFIFYYDVDGLPFKNLYLSYFMQGDETASKLCYWTSPSRGNLFGISEHEQVIDVDERGLLQADISNYRKPGKVYKENSAVIKPDQALQQVKAYYDRKLILEDVTITNVELVYTGYFSDASEGEIQPIITPVWAVTVHEETNQDMGITRGYVYDAFSGECLSEGNTSL